MKTAIITGASAGLGQEIVRQLGDVFPEIECYWLIARRADRLESLAISLPGKTTVCLPLDLCDPMSFVRLQEKLAEDRPEVSLLVNNAGCGYLGRIGEADTASQTRMVDLNLRALTAVTNMTVPYMSRGGRILNVSSIASFCPNPRMTVYSWRRVISPATRRCSRCCPTATRSGSRRAPCGPPERAAPSTLLSSFTSSTVCWPRSRR